MTTTFEDADVLDDDLLDQEPAVGADDLGDPSAAPPTDGEREAVPVRPIVATALSTTAAALVVGGIFNSWPARLFGLAVGVGGSLLAAWVLRSRRRLLAELAAPLIIAVVAVFSVLPGASPGDLQRVVRDALNAGRLLQIPIPFDPGWRPLLTVVLGLLGFGSAWVATSTRRPMVGVVLPIPLVALAAISQPTSEQVVAGVLGFLPILAAFAVLFGGEALDGERELGRQFEVTR